MIGSGLTITANGSYDPITTFYSGGASNNGFGKLPDGGTLMLSNSTIVTTGTQTFGVYTANGGIDDPHERQDHYQGRQRLCRSRKRGGGQTTINGGSVTTQRSEFARLFTRPGIGSSIATTNLPASGPVTVTTSGVNSIGVLADTGGAVALTGGSVTTALDGSEGLFASGSGSTISASGVAVTTNGGYSAATDRFSEGILAFNGGA